MASVPGDSRIASQELVLIHPPTTLSYRDLGREPAGASADPRHMRASRPERGVTRVSPRLDAHTFPVDSFRPHSVVMGAVE